MDQEYDPYRDTSIGYSKSYPLEMAHQAALRKGTATPQPEDDEDFQIESYTLRNEQSSTPVEQPNDEGILPLTLSNKFKVVGIRPRLEPFEYSSAYLNDRYGHMINDRRNSSRGNSPINSYRKVSPNWLPNIKNSVRSRGCAAGAQLSSQRIAASTSANFASSAKKR